MRVTKRVWSMGAVVLVLGAMGVAAAQPAAATGGADPLAPAETNQTPEQMKTEAAMYLPQMEQGTTSVRRQVEEARAARDVVKLQCLNDKLTQLDVATRTAKDRYASFMSASERSDLERLRHEFTVLQVLRDRARDLVAEAQQCIGEETGFIGESRVTVEVPPNLPDPAVYPDSPIISIPPTISSPTQ
jgi:hypothetical protein